MLKKKKREIISLYTSQFVVKSFASLPLREIIIVPMHTMLYSLQSTYTYIISFDHNNPINSIEHFTNEEKEVHVGLVDYLEHCFSKRELLSFGQDTASFCGAVR